MPAGGSHVQPRVWQANLPHLIVASAVVLRLLEYFRKDSLWGDEAMLALNIATRPFPDLARPLGYAQIAPVPFLWAERILTSLFGVNEWALRVLPLLAGLALCLIFLRIARRVVRPDEAIVALALVAFSSVLIRYSAEVKPYSLDALLSVGLIGSAAELLRSSDTRKSWVLTAGLGMVALLCSMGAVFVCLGIGTALAAQALRTRQWHLLPRLGLMALGWAALFGVTYLQLYQEGAGVPYMRSFWEGSFLLPGSAHLLARVEVAVSELFWATYPGMALLGLNGLTLLLLLLGTVTLWRRGQASDALLLLVPGVAPFAASALGLYPIAMRLLLFAAPLLLMLTAVGVSSVSHAVSRASHRVPTHWVPALLLLPAITTAIASGLQERDQQMAPLLRRLAERWGSADAVYVFHRVVPAWLFYTTDWSSPDTRLLAWAMRVSGPGEIGHENGPSRGVRPAGEGEQLVYSLKDRRVLLGTSSGVQGRPVFGYNPRQADAGWATNEARRMHRAARPRIWMVLGNASHEGLDLGDVLRDTLRKEGGLLTFQDSLQDGKLYRFEFASPAPDTRGPAPSPQ